MQVCWLVLALLVLCINGFTWGNGRRGRADNPSELSSSSRLPNIYAVALSELQELELEPLCHRVAARLLVNNCELVDGKDEATILTDSGRKVRDFVDSYAASLAICDLERGNFAIPAECAKFREPSLSQIAIRNEPLLHAARADHEKAKNILLYQRLTRVIAQLTDSVEAELQQRINDLDNRARQSVERLEQLTPQIGRLSEGLAKVERYLSENLDLALRQSSKSISEGLQHADNLQQLLSILLANVLESNSQLAFAHEESLQRVSQRVNDDMGALVAVMSTTMASSSSLQKQIATVLAQRQETLQHGMNRLAIATETLSEQLEDHSSMLKQVNNITADILDTLEETAVVASSANESLSRATTLSWWPFVIFPTASLVLGSYGLQPSILRNLVLLALGGLVGFMVSSYDQLTTQLVAALEATADITESSI
ncbi:hypothetical protein N657DRAFT_632075 [Parathielavia appendiculata]|uniref:Uncharacterized protein n=1 Tax=Parathielavia appendiculata TaxID=2587402 RepID=A0AAN6Z5E2_9PEZI|nr:hypothetical protein N657DRAFT_632075 [Parathielavia appendiculata]